jgi:hypothetical protein
MRKSQIDAYKRRWRALHEIEIQETRAATYAERWKKLNAIYGLGLGLGLVSHRFEDELPVHLRWAELKRAFENS